MTPRCFLPASTATRKKTGACIEVFLLRELNQELRLWDVLVDPARKIRIGNKLYFGEDNSIVAEVIDNTTSRGRTLRFLYDGDHDEFKKQLYALGEAPIPRFIGRPSEPEDLERFQCIFAKNEGAVTAPATGLHFSRELMKRMEIKGINFAYITLHCGMGCFRETDVEDLTKHKMDSEQMFVEQECCDIVNKTKEEEHKVVAVGTTVQRALKPAWERMHASRLSKDGPTSLSSRPTTSPWQMPCCQTSISPYSTMLMLTAAFGDYDYTMHAYNVALKEDYKFGPYGDVMLIID